MHLTAAELALEDPRRVTARWSSFAEERRFALLDGDWCANRPSPRAIDTAERYAAAIHPEIAPEIAI
jgi:hypothetical protein